MKLGTKDKYMLLVLYQKNIFGYQKTTIWPYGSRQLTKNIVNQIFVSIVFMFFTVTVTLGSL